MRGETLQLLVHHDDAKREYAYGPDSKIGTFSDALMDEAIKQCLILRLHVINFLIAKQRSRDG